MISLSVVRSTVDGAWLMTPVLASSLLLLLLSADGDVVWTGEVGSFAVDDKTMYSLDSVVSEPFDECCCWLSNCGK